MKAARRDAADAFVVAGVAVWIHTGM